MMMENEQEEQRIGIDEEINKERYEQCRENSNVFLPYDILRFIFGYLNGMDLSSAAMVCRLWLDIAIDEKCSRGPHCFLGQYSISTEGNYNFDCLKQSKIKPLVGFFFLHSSICYEDVKDSIYELLPTNCKTIILFTNTVVINNEILTLNEQSDMICALLPQIPNINIDIIKNYAKANFEYVDDELQNQPSPSNTIREDCEIHMYSMVLQNNYVKNQNMICFIEPSKAVDAGIREMMRTNKPFIPNDEEVTLTHSFNAVYFFITDDIKMWSIDLDDKCLTRKSIEKKLKTFEEQVKLQKHSLSFMFYSRKRVMPNVDLAIFKKLFPKIPLVGCYSHEIREKNYIKREDFYFQCFHSERFNKPACTFIVLTYG